MADRELAHCRLVGSLHGEFSNFGSGTVCAKNHGAADSGTIAERGNYTITAFVECNIHEVFAVLAEEIDLAKISSSEDSSRLLQ